MTKIACVMPEPPVKDDKGNLVAYVDIVDTPSGRIAYQLAKYGYKFGISSRGTGDIIYDNDGNEIVDPDTYQLNAFDLVEIPAVESARLAFVESLDTKKKYGKTLKQKLTEEVNKATEEDKKIMEETLKNLDIELNEKLVKPSKEDINAVKDRLYILGFDVVGEGETLFGNTHLQLKLKGTNHNGEDLNRLAVSLSDISDDFDKKGLPITYNIGLDNNFDITCGLDIRDKYVKDVNEELQNEEGWGDYINDESEYLFDELEALMYEIRNCRRGSYAGFGDTVPDLVEELNRLSDALTDLALRIDYNESELTEKCGKKDAKLKENIPTEKSAQRELIGKLYLLNQMTNKILEYDRNFDFNEEENELVKKHLNDTLDGIKKIANKLNDTIGEDCSDKEDSKIKTEVVNNKDGLVKDLQEALAKSAKLEKDNLSLQEQLSVCTAKEIKLREDLKKSRKALANLSETAKKVTVLKEQLEDFGGLLKKKDLLLESTKKELDDKKKLREQFVSKEQSNLKEQIKELNVKLSDKDKKLSDNKVITEKLKLALNRTKDSYIKAQAAAFGVNEQEVRAMLKESYTIKDVDSVCEELSEHKFNLGKLPFRLNENTRLNYKASSNEYIRGNNFLDDDVISDNLLRMLD